MDDSPDTHQHRSGSYVLGTFLLLAGFFVTAYFLVERLGNGIAWSEIFPGLLLGVVSLLIGGGRLRQVLRRN